MLARCSFGASSTARSRPSPSVSRGSLRHQFSIPERSRKLPNAPTPFRLAPGPRKILYGVAVVASAAAGWQGYEWLSKDRSFTTYRLESRDPLSSTLSIFRLEPENGEDRRELYREAWRRGIWNVQFKQPQLQIIRAYTPLPPLEVAGENEVEALRFLIRRDPHGEVSSYLHRLPLGSSIQLRGPYLEYEITPKVQQVVFFAGGTGIAPAIQLAHAMFEGQQARDAAQPPPHTRKLHILWASRRREDCEGGVSDPPPTETLPPRPTWSGLFTKTPPKPAPIVSSERGLIVQELEALKQKHPGQITVEYFVNTEDTWIDDDAVHQALSRFDAKDFSGGAATSDEARQVLISGPPGFITYLAGEKIWRNGREQQGPLRGILAHALSKNPHHVKIWKI